MAKIRVLVDVNVILDVLGRRTPFYDDSAKVWYYVETGQVEGFLAAHTITTLYYLLEKHHTVKSAMHFIGDLLSVFEIAEVNKNTLLQALTLGWTDFEDGVQVIAAAQNNCHYWVTRDNHLFSNNPIIKISPIEFIRLIQIRNK